jgi:hypothetical protein
VVKVGREVENQDYAWISDCLIISSQRGFSEPRKTSKAPRPKVVWEEKFISTS